MIVQGFDGRCHTVPDRYGIHAVGDGSHVHIWAGGVTRLCPSRRLGDRLALGFLKASHALLDPLSRTPRLG
jgi:hypothetical protein